MTPPPIDPVVIRKIAQEVLKENRTTSKSVRQSVLTPPVIE